MDARKRLVVIGLDGLSWDTCNILMRYCSAATLKYLLDRAQKKTLISTIPPMTAIAWTSIFTGVNPGKHGIFGFLHFNKYSSSARLATSRDVKYPRIWEVLSRHGYDAQLVVNIPLSTPFNKFSGVGIPDWLSQRPRIYVHENIKSHVNRILREEYKNLIAYSGKMWWFLGGDISLALKLMLDDLMRKTDAYIKLLEAYEWETIFIVFSEIDWIQHVAFKELATLNKSVLKVASRLLECIDRVLEKIYKVFGKDAIYVFVSDHGFRIYTRMIYLNKYLIDAGLVKVSTFARAIYTNDITYGIANKICRLMNTLLRKEMPRFLRRGTVEYSHSLAFMPEDASSLGVRINKILLHKLGIPYRDFRAKIMRYLVNLNRRCGFLSIIEPRERIYWGKYVSYGPDIVLLPNINRGDWIFPSMSTKYIKKTTYGYHDMEGVFGLVDLHDDFHIRDNIVRLSVYDVAPIIFSVLGVAPPKGLDGKDPRSIFTK